MKYFSLEIIFILILGPCPLCSGLIPGTVLRDQSWWSSGYYDSNSARDGLGSAPIHSLQNENFVRFLKCHFCINVIWPLLLWVGRYYFATLAFLECWLGYIYCLRNLMCVVRVYTDHEQLNWVWPPELQMFPWALPGMTPKHRGGSKPEHSRCGL